MRLIQVVEDVYFEKFVEEEILYVDGVLPRVKDDEFYNQSYSEYISSDPPMVNK